MIGLVLLSAGYFGVIIQVYMLVLNLCYVIRGIYILVLNFCRRFF